VATDSAAMPVSIRNDVTAFDPPVSAPAPRAFPRINICLGLHLGKRLRFLLLDHSTAMVTQVE